jgi:hypothetical protein
LYWGGSIGCGFAPILADISGPTEIVVNDVNSLVVPPLDQIQLDTSDGAAN